MCSCAFGVLATVSFVDLQTGMDQVWLVRHLTCFIICLSEHLAGMRAALGLCFPYQTEHKNSSDPWLEWHGCCLLLISNCPDSLIHLSGSSGVLKMCFNLPFLVEIFRFDASSESRPGYAKCIL